MTPEQREEYGFTDLPDTTVTGLAWLAGLCLGVALTVLAYVIAWWMA